MAKVAKKKRKKRAGKIFFAWLCNKVDNRDDEVVKLRASSKRQAKKIAENYVGYRFTLGNVFTQKQFKRYEPDWHALLWGQAAENEDDED